MLVISMKIRVFLVALTLCLGACPGALAVDAPDASAPGASAPLEIGELQTVWRDAARQREVPAKVFYPQTGGPFPLIVLSHGLGGSRDGLDYLGKFWAAHGYVCAQIQHLGSDESVWRGATTEEEARAALGRAGRNPTNILNRPRDVSFAIDQMLKLNADKTSELDGKISDDQIGVAGHSLGALTALASAGQKLIGGGIALDLSDPRIRACVAMSSPLNPSAPLAKQFADFETPTFYIVGSLDKEVLGATIAQRQIYDAIAAPDQFLLILNGADHMTFAGGRFNQPDLPADASDHALTQSATLAFWNAELKDQSAAKVWLRDEFPRQLEDNSVFEAK